MTTKPNKAIHFADGVTVVALERRNGDVLPFYIGTSDYELVKEYHWYANRNGNTYYAVTNVRKTDGSRTKLYLHRLLLPDAKEVDHRDGNGLNNRRANLRAATRSQNGCNRKKQSAMSSVFKGVCWHKREGKWYARIQVNGKTIHLGFFDSELDAARAYNEAAKEHFGAFARLNVIASQRDEQLSIAA